MLLYHKAMAIPSKKGLQNLCFEKLLSKGNEVCSCDMAGQQAMADIHLEHVAGR